MSDHDAAPDPIDTAYVQAEAVLNDDDARTARRARVLAAIAREPATSPAATFPAKRRPAWRRGGWLVAASVAGLGVFVATHIYQQAPHPVQTAPTTPAVPPPGARKVTAAPTAPARVPTRTPEPAPRTLAAAPPATLSATPPAATPLAPDLHSAEGLPPPPPLELPPAPKAPPPPPPRDVVVTGERRAAAPAADDSGLPSGHLGDEAVDAQNSASRAGQKALVPALAAPPAPAPLTGFEPSADLQPAQAARLRAAAAAGHTAELDALLAQGVPVDAPDADGNTALMKSIQADQPAAAALLRRYGASLDHRNHAGERARDMAAAKGDAELNQAIGLGP